MIYGCFLYNVQLAWFRRPILWEIMFKSASHKSFLIKRINYIISQSNTEVFKTRYSRDLNKNCSSQPWKICNWLLRNEERFAARYLMSAQNTRWSKISPAYGIISFARCPDRKTNYDAFQPNASIIENSLR